MAQDQSPNFPDWAERAAAWLERVVQEGRALRDEAFDHAYNAWSPAALSSALAALETAAEFAGWEQPADCAGGQRFLVMKEFRPAP